MNRTRALTMIAGAALTILFVAASSGGPIHLADRAPSLDWGLDNDPGSQPDELPARPEREQPTPLTPRHIDLPEFVTAAFKVLLVAIALRVVLLLWDLRPRVRWRRAARAEEFDVLDHIADLVAADVETQRRALQMGAARNAIVACWLRLEALVESAGYDRDPAATTAEFTATVLTRFAVDDQAVDQLAALYREARFSSHPMGEAERAAAIVALESIHAGLRRDEATSAL